MKEFVGGRKTGQRAASIRETDDSMRSTASTSPQAGEGREERKRGSGSGTWVRNGVGLFLGQSSGLTCGAGGQLNYMNYHTYRLPT